MSNPTIEEIKAAGVFDSPHYRQAVKVTGARSIVFLAGQVARTPDGKVAYPGDFAGQVRAALRDIQALVAAAGGTMDSIVKINAYTADERYREEWRAVCREFFPGKLPATTRIQVSGFGLPGWLVEVEAIAVV
jgi:enamine deaminase RidA (YjgF/YER057c/UK114 family)